MILRPMGASLGMLSLALVAKWAFLLGLGLGGALLGAVCALRREREATDGAETAPAPAADGAI